MSTIVGLDWDDVTLKYAMKRQSLIEKEQKVKTLLYKTKHGFHLEMFYNSDIPVDKNFSIRTKYWDDENRIRIGKRRYEITGSNYDLLFCVKNGYWRRLIR